MVISRIYPEASLWTDLHQIYVIIRDKFLAIG